MSDITRPLIDLANGRDQDNRSAVLSAFWRILNSRRRREPFDLHVRELITYVLANDRDGRGIQLSYDDIGNVLACERSTARAVVRRLMEVYGLVAITEDRYVRGGQAPNRYSIDWAAVRSVNQGCMQSGAVSIAVKDASSDDDQPGAVPVSAAMQSAVINGRQSIEPNAVSDRQAGVATLHPGVATMHPLSPQCRGMHRRYTPLRNIP